MSARMISSNIYSSSGNLIKTRYLTAVINTPTPTGTKTHIANFTFGSNSNAADTLTRVDFPGGYFDAKGGVHWMLTDAIGSIEMVVDSRGSVEQHTGYYPYGEPWRNPAGQPYLFGAKERRSYASLNDYDFHARFYTAANTLWHAPDSHAGNRPWMSPFTFCSANPIRRIDPTGKDDKQLEWAKKHGIVIPFADEPTNEDYAREIARQNFEKAMSESYMSAKYPATNTLNVINQEDLSPIERETLSEINRSAMATAEIVTSMAASGTSIPEVIVKAASKKATKLKGDIAISTYAGPEAFKFLKFLRGFGYLGCAVSIGNTVYTLQRYTESGGDNNWVYCKLVLDFCVAVVGLCNHPAVFAGVLIYNITDFATRGFGSDKIIEHQIKSK